MVHSARIRPNPASPNKRRNKSLFASFSSEKEESLFFSEEKNQKTFNSWRRLMDTGLGRRAALFIA
jgi:hypothetical protein